VKRGGGQARGKKEEASIRNVRSHLGSAFQGRVRGWFLGPSYCMDGPYKIIKFSKRGYDSARSDGTLLYGARTTQGLSSLSEKVIPSREGKSKEGKYLYRG